MAQTFFVDEDVRAGARLDSVTTVVDARHVLASIADSREARQSRMVFIRRDLDEAALRAGFEACAA